MGCLAGPRRSQEAKDFPLVGCFRREPSIVHVNALHDNNDGTGALVIEARQERVPEPLVRRCSLGLRNFIKRLQRVIYDDGIPPRPAMCPNRRRQSGSLIWS